MAFETYRAYGRAGSLLTIISVVSAFALPIISILSTLSLLNSSTGYTIQPSIYTSGYFLFSILVFLMALAGGILVLISMHGFANHYKDRAIFNNVLYGIISGIVGAVIIGVLFFLSFLTLFSNPTIYSTQASSAALNFAPIATVPPNFSAIWSIIGAFALVWLGFVAVSVAQNWFFKRALDHLAQNSGENRFKDAGLLMLIGGALTIVFIGGIVIFVAWIFVTLGFFSMQKPPTLAEFPASQYPSPSSAP